MYIYIYICMIYIVMQNGSVEGNEPGLLIVGQLTLGHRDGWVVPRMLPKITRALSVTQRLVEFGEKTTVIIHNHPLGESGCQPSHFLGSKLLTQSTNLHGWW